MSPMLHQRLIEGNEDVTDMDLDAMLVMRDSGKYEWQLSDAEQARIALWEKKIERLQELLEALQGEPD